MNKACTSMNEPFICVTSLTHVKHMNVLEITVFDMTVFVMTVFDMTVFDMTSIHMCDGIQTFLDGYSAQEWTNRTPISHEPLIYGKMCFTKTESVQ